jgi:mono/diheme cytochrome c family protein
LPDFKVESVVPSQEAPEAGHNITFLVVVANVGVADGTAALEVWDGAPLGANSTLIKQEFLALKAGQTERVLAPWNATPGVHNIVAKVVLSQPSESNLLNNELNVTLTVAKPQETPLPPLLPGFGGLLAAVALGAGAWKGRPPRERPSNRRSKKAAAGAMALLLTAALAAAVVPAPTGASLQDAGAVPGPLNGVCQTCHTNPNGGGPLNAFGGDYWAERNATNGSVNWSRLGLLDSDGDGTNNADEWNASYLPGDAGSNPGTGVKYGGFTPGGLSGILTGLLVLLLISIVGAWLGYSSFRRRAARQAAKEADGAQNAAGHDAAPKP